MERRYEAKFVPVDTDEVAKLRERQAELSRELGPILRAELEGGIDLETKAKAWDLSREQEEIRRRLQREARPRHLVTITRQPDKPAGNKTRPKATETVVEIGPGGAIRHLSGEPITGPEIKHAIRAAAEAPQEGL